MPQTSPMMWMMLSLTPILLLNMFFTSNVPMAMKMNQTGYKKVKILMKWTW